ncbi:hypothetical protein E2C01_042053 [Portunus trituberculatus]|uniref:Uncharacterized protein n=1 Tax=Portunus trituberculatus TaxID=210409 RepID=A0A5B7FSB8_PORTR|nr:hypothetical protein [Portunus trituberculatus]
MGTLPLGGFMVTRSLALQPRCLSLHSKHLATAPLVLHHQAPHYPRLLLHLEQHLHGPIPDWLFPVALDAEILQSVRYCHCPPPPGPHHTRCSVLSPIIPSSLSVGRLLRPSHISCFTVHASTPTALHYSPGFPSWASQHLICPPSWRPLASTSHCNLWSFTLLVPS